MRLEPLRRLAAIAALVLVGCGAAIAQDDDKSGDKAGDKKGEAAAPLEPTDAIIKALGEAYKLKNEPQAIAALENAVKAVKDKERPNKEKDQIVKAMASGLDSKNPKVAIAAANALGRIGEPGTKVLVKALKSKRILKVPESYKAVIDAIGLARDEKAGVSALLKIATRDKDWKARGWAGNALGQFNKNHAKGKTRKKICEKLIQVLEGAESAASDGRDQTAQQRLGYIQGAFVQTLRTLTEQEHNTALDWRRWFNKAKRERWADPPKPKKEKK